MGQQQSEVISVTFPFLSFFSCRFFVMYSIMPETEQRSLEDIELHYSDPTKRITDIHIARRSEAIENSK